MYLLAMLRQNGLYEFRCLDIVGYQPAVQPAVDPITF